MRKSDLVKVDLASDIPYAEIAQAEDLQEKCEIIAKRMSPNTNADLSTILHYMFLANAFESEAFHDSQVELMDIVTGAKRVSWFEPVFLRTRYGARIPLHNYDIAASEQRSAEAHPGQLIATFATLGVELDQSIYVGKARVLLRDLYNDLVANFSLSGEIYWQSVAISIYQPPGQPLLTKFGETYTFDAISNELCSRRFDDSSCGGTHILIASTVLLRSSIARGLLSPTAQEQLQSRLVESVKRLKSSELPDGGWDFHWHDDKRTSGNPTPEEIITSTGHHIEWLLMMPKDLQPHADLYSSAARSAMRQVSLIEGAGSSLEANYCPVTHVLRSVKLLTDRRL